MVSLPYALPLRFGAAEVPPPMELRLARRGARAFAPRGGGDARVVLPEVAGEATVLVPRGFGHPLPAVRHGGGELRAEQGGAPCSPARWVPAGGLAAWARRVAVPRGPARALRAELPTGDGGPWLHVRVAALEWAALRRSHPAAGSGPVAVADRWVRAASPEARARGVVRGMSVALARRRCPGLVVWPRPLRSLVDEVHERLSGWLGPVGRAGAGYVARLGASVALGPEALAVAERVARLLWQELGVEAAVALAAHPRAARGLAALLEPGWVGVAPVAATAAWSSRPGRAARASAGARAVVWRGDALPDLEGAAARARLLAAGLLGQARGGALRVRVEGERGVRVARVRVPEGVGRAGLGHLVESLVRRLGATLSAIRAVRLRCVDAPSARHGRDATVARGPWPASRPGEAPLPAAAPTVGERPAGPSAGGAPRSATRRPPARGTQPGGRVALWASPGAGLAAEGEALHDPAAEAAARRRASRAGGGARPDARPAQVQLALLPGLR